MEEPANQENSIYEARPLPQLPAHWSSLGHAFLHQARLQRDTIAISDSTGTTLTYFETLQRAIGLANLLRSELNNSRCVGILLPPSAGAAIVNLALAFLDKVSVNLNYTSSNEILDSCIDACSITQVISSKRMLERVNFSSKTAQLLLAENLIARASLTVKALAWTEAHLIPENFLDRAFPGLSEHSAGSDGLMTQVTQSLKHKHIDDVATIMFTTGSTGQPKGVMLTHRNILSNIWGIQNHAKISRHETILGVMPFFHCFGLTLTLWAVLVLGHRAVYHYNPLEARAIGSLCHRHLATVLFCTPTIMRGYLSRCSPDQFASLKICIVGGEKLSLQLAEELESKLGIVALDGYGMTEASPVISCNIPWDFELPDGRRTAGNRKGTAGLPLPGTSMRIVNQYTFQDVPRETEGLIMVRGPQIMAGYLNDPHQSSVAIKDGWFSTGDLGRLDQDGFLTITGRLSQFAKIGGEMVSHLAVEEEILDIVKPDGVALAVTSVPDSTRGEKLVVLYSDQSLDPATVVEELTKKHISRLWIPKASDFVKVDRIPVMPNGKLSIKEVRALAAQSQECAP